MNNELETIESLVADLRAAPDRYPDSAALARAFHLAPEELHRLSIVHYHLSPDELLLRARLAATKPLLADDRDSLRTIARSVGFPSVSALRQAFLTHNGLTPDAYRALDDTRSFRLQLPPDFSIDYFRRYLSRDPYCATSRFEGDTYRFAHPFPDGPLRIALKMSRTTGSVTLSRSTPHIRQAHAIVTRLLGLKQNTAAWAAHAEHHGFASLLAAAPGLRIPQTPDVYTGLLWTIMGQQINLAFACRLQQRLVHLTGVPAGDNLYAAPTPEAVAALDPAVLAPLQFTRSKADYLTSLSRLIASGQLDLEALRTCSATRAERILLAQRGLGRWSVNYLMLRALGFADCLPLGDTGVTSSLYGYFHTPARPGPEETITLMEPFRPFRSLATAHLWQWKPAP